MKKYKSPVFRHIHEEAADFFKDGIISAAEMKEFDASCLVAEADTPVSSSRARITMNVSATKPHRQGIK
jgi:putative transcriptional regulator